MTSGRLRLALLALAALLSLALSGAVPAAGRVERPVAAPLDSLFTTFIVVRHAEKSVTFVGHDAPLDTAGLRRAEALARALGDAGVTRVYATPTRRAIQTAEPLARRIGDSVRAVHETEALLARLRAHAPGEVIVVVGHSNTVPDIVKGLCGDTIPAFAPGEFDRMVIVTRDRAGAAKVLRLRYGAPD